MSVADLPAVVLGNIASPKIPFKLARGIAASIFAILGLATLVLHPVGLSI
jgi:putative Ca2+/H+ antiporter (TMEM165/GDT1 family)